MINQEKALDFLKKAYFGGTNGNIDKFDLASNRAYRDLCRTIHFTNKPATNATKLESRNFLYKKLLLRNSVTTLFRNEISHIDISKYDEWHEKTCDEIISIYRKEEIPISYGQAQKWVNMFMKYLCILSPETVSPFISNLHVPFDNIVIDMAVEMGAFDRPLSKWSKWTKENYLDYCAKLNKQIRKIYPRTPPIVWEFENWKGDVRLDLE